MSRFNIFTDFAKCCLGGLVVGHNAIRTVGRLASVLTGFFALAVASPGCPGKDSRVYDGGEAAGVYEAALSGDTAARESAAAYWVVDRIEDGAADGEGVAVLENIWTRRTVERPVKELPADIEEGRVLTDGGALRIDYEDTTARAARIMGRFERLKTN